MAPDPNGDENGCYRVTSLYYDDVYHRAYNQKIAGAEDRAKFRIRAYNGDNSHIVLECKHKRGQFIRKTAILLADGEYERLLSGGDSFLAGRGRLAEDYIRLTRTVNLRPFLLVDYTRQAFTYEGNVRVTLDFGVRAAAGSGLFDPNPLYYGVTGGAETVMEVKYDHYMPAAVRALLSGISPLLLPVSKYVMCADKIMEVRQHA
jgi:hypothetical protein